MNYSCEIWGNSKSKEIERIHLKFCKKILNVKLSTSNVTVYGELGRYPLYINRFTRILKYWFKILSTDNCILKAVYTCAYDDCCNSKKNWLYDVKNMLYRNGYGYVWEDPFSVNHKSFVLLFKQKLFDCFQQELFENINNSRTLTVYRAVKNTFLYEPYLDIIKNNKHRQLLTRLRVSAHRLRIESARYGRNRLERHERLCEICEDRTVEDEYHFILICGKYKDLRNILLPKYYTRRPSMLKFVELLSCTKKNTLCNLCQYIEKALVIRQNCIRNIST